MSMIPNAAPLARAKDGAFRDDRPFFIGCDDRYAPDQYFGFFKMPRIKLCEIPASDDKSHAIHVLKKLQELEVEEDDERWMILDTDHCLNPDHFSSYEQAISEARRQQIKIAISRPSFESWLLLHHAPAGKLAGCKNADEVGEALKSVLGHYNKTSLRDDDFPLETVPQAYSQALALDATVGGGDKPTANTTRVYKLWRSIIAKAAVSQLPKCLTGLWAQIQIDERIAPTLYQNPKAIVENVENKEKG